MTDPWLCSFARLNGAPLIGEAGLLVAVSFAPTHPLAGSAQGVIAHAQDGAGWWVGIGADGRAVVGMGTSAGPLSLAVGAPLAVGEWVRVHVRVPGRAGERLRIELADRAGARAPQQASVMIGSTLVPAPGSVVWGARALRDRRIPEHPFTGHIADLVLIADAGAEPDTADPRVVLGRWDVEILVDAGTAGWGRPLAL